MFPYVAFLAIAFAAPADSSPTFEVRARVEGQSVATSGRLVALDEKQATIRAADGNESSFSIKQLFSIRRAAAAPADEKGQGEPSILVTLVDGSTIWTTDFASSGRSATITLGPDAQLDMLSSAVAHVSFRPRLAEAGLMWKQFIERPATSDQIALIKGDRIDSLECVVRSIDKSAVTIELDGDAIRAPRAKVHGVVYFQLAGRHLPEARCVIEEASGSRWLVEAISIHDDELRFTTCCGASIVRPLKAIAALDFSFGKVRYLSDLDPEQVRFTPYFARKEQSAALEAIFGPRRDEGFFGGKLQLRSSDGESLKQGAKVVEFDKGLALHSRTQIVYRLPGGFSTFAALAGIDARVAPAGSVRLTIDADGKKLFDKTISGSDDATAISVDVRSAARLTILVDFGDEMDVADRLNLADARIEK